MFSNIDQSCYLNIGAEGRPCLYQIVISFLSFAAVKANFPVGWRAMAVIPAECLYKVFSTCQEPILTTAMVLSSLAVNKCEVAECVAKQDTVPWSLKYRTKGV